MGRAGEVVVDNKLYLSGGIYQVVVEKKQNEKIEDDVSEIRNKKTGIIRKRNGREGTF